jgi:hypothetical protein
MTHKPARIVGGAPTFCHSCNRQLMRAPGKGLGLFYAVIVERKRCGGHQYRMHAECARRELQEDGTEFSLVSER